MTKRLGEFELIERFFAQGGARRGDVLLGIGDDAALVRVPDGSELVVVVDTIVAGVHFPLETPPEYIGHRALAVNLSDIAAMGATPAWATLALTLPTAEEGWLEAFSRGFLELARLHDVMLIGGDTTSGPLTVTVQILGHAPAGSALRRSGARVGDLICVSGSVGDAAAGLALLERRAQISNDRDAQYLRERFLKPSPRVTLGGLLRGTASAAIDISDGLYADLARLLSASRTGARIDLEKLPESAALKSGFDPAQALDLMLNGGDDYELCFTVAAAQFGDLVDMNTTAGCPTTVIGVVEARAGVRTYKNGRAVSIDVRGFDHFAP